MNIKIGVVGATICSAIMLCLVPGLPAQTTKDPALKVLRPQDWPSGFRRTTSGYRPNAKVARENDLPISLLRRWGRINGYGLTLRRAPDIGGAVLIYSGADIFSAAAGADKELDWYIREIQPTHSGQSAFTAVAVNWAIGRRFRLFTTVDNSTGVPIRAFAASWADRDVVEFLADSGLDGTFDRTIVRTLARRQERQNL